MKNNMMLQIYFSKIMKIAHKQSNNASEQGFAQLNNEQLAKTLFFMYFCHHFLLKT